MTNPTPLTEEELRFEPDWKWMTDLLRTYDIKKKGIHSDKDGLDLEAALYKEIGRRYVPRPKIDFVRKPDGHNTSKQYEDAKRIHADAIEAMDSVGFGLTLDAKRPLS